MVRTPWRSDDQAPRRKGHPLQNTPQLTRPVGNHGSQLDLTPLFHQSFFNNSAQQRHVNIPTTHHGSHRLIAHRNLAS
jgi:hypothetical protein